MKRAYKGAAGFGAFFFAIVILGFFGLCTFGIVSSLIFESEYYADAGGVIEEGMSDIANSDPVIGPIVLDSMGALILVVCAAPVILFVVWWIWWSITTDRNINKKLERRRKHG